MKKYQRPAIIVHVVTPSTIICTSGNVDETEVKDGYGPTKAKSYNSSWEIDE